MINIAFDVDGTLIGLGQGLYPEPRWEVINMLILLSSTAGCRITVWSGAGEEWASTIVNRFGIKKYVSIISEKPRITKDYIPLVDIAFDDEAVQFGKVNIRIPCLDVLSPRDL